MPGTIGQFTGTLPLVGAKSFGSALNTLLQAIIDALNSGVTIAGLTVDDLLDMRGHDLVNCAALRLTVTTDDGTAGQLFFNDAGELCCRDMVGNLIQFTEGGSINITGTGGIGGDYASTNPNGASYSASTLTFTWTSGVGIPAKMEMGDIIQGQGSDTNRVTLKCPTSLAADYTLTWPATLPTARRVLEVDRTGTLAHTAWPRMSGVIGENNNFVISGTIRQTETWKMLGMYQVLPRFGSASYSGAGWLLNGVVGTQTTVDVGLDMEQGQRLRSVKFNYSGSQMTASLYIRESGNTTQQGVSVKFGTTATADQMTITTSGSWGLTAAEDDAVFIRVNTAAVLTGALWTVQVNTDRPEGAP